MGANAIVATDKQENLSSSSASPSSSSSVQIKLNSTGQQLYRPFIYSSSCYGYCTLSNKVPMDHRGVCYGYQTQVNMMMSQQDATNDNEKTSSHTRNDAIREFVHNEMRYDSGEEEGKAQDKKFDETLELLLSSPSVVYHECNKGLCKRPQLSTCLHNEDEVVLSQPQTWDCFGSTTVDYLVLENVDNGEAKLAAVAPRNANGLAFRQCQASEKNYYTFVQLSYLDVGRVLVLVNAFNGLTSCACRLQRFSHKIVSHMHRNANWIAKNLNNNFHHRMFAAGEKTVAHFPKTIGLMHKTAEKLWQNASNGDEHK